MVPNQSEVVATPQIVNLSEMKVESVHADLVRASQTAISQLNSEEIDLQTSIVGTVRTTELRARDSAMGAVTSTNSTVVDSIVAGIQAETMEFNGAVGLAISNNLVAEEIKSLAIITNSIKAGSINTGFLFSRKVNGNVTTTFDGQTALIVGVVGGVVAGLILLTGKLLIGRKN